MWEPRPQRGLGSWWSIALGAVVVAVGLLGLSRTAAETCRQLHVALELAGSDQRLSTWIPACTPDLGAARQSLLWDLVLIAGCALGAAAILRRWWPLYEATRLKAAERTVVLLPFVVGGLNVVENALIAGVLRVRDGRFAFPEHMGLPVTIATVSGIRWITGAVVVVTVVMAILLAAARRNEPSRPVALATMPVPDPADLPAPDGLGICCSGGGIRAAAFALGALDRLEHRGVTDRARWLTCRAGRTRPRRGPWPAPPTPADRSPATSSTGCPNRSPAARWVGIGSCATVPAASGGRRWRPLRTCC